MLYHIVSILFLMLIVTNTAFAEDIPTCLSADAKTNVESIIASHPIHDHELLARLVYAESLSTGFRDDQLVYNAIAWGVMNRVRLGEASPSMRRAFGVGIRGVIFKKGQFNPAISKRSPFSKAFLCPDHTRHWNMARSAAETTLNGTDNPFIQTSWEKQNNLSLVVNFYYPQSVQAKGRRAPWEGNKSLTFIGNVLIGDKTLSAKRIRFYRLQYPPTDMKKR